MYTMDWFPQPATPHIDLLVVANPAMFTAYGRAPYAQLPPADLTLLAADPAVRCRYCASWSPRCSCPRCGACAYFLSRRAT